MRARLPIVLLLLLTACFPRGGAKPPPALDDYLQAIRDGNYAEAYRATQLADLSAGFGPGASLSAEHFEAFWRAQPLRDWSVKRVTRLDRRALDAPREQGSPFFEIDIELTVGDDVVDETLTIEGEVLATIMIEPARILLRDATGRRRALTVDGVATALSDAPVGPEDAYALLLLRGRHTLALEGSAPVTITTEPLRVITGPADVQDGPPAVLLAG